MGASTHYTAAQSAAAMPPVMSSERQPSTKPQRTPSIEAPRGTGNNTNGLRDGRETMQNGGRERVHPAAVTATAENLNRVIANAGH